MATTVLGIGNPLLGDEGVGLAILDALAARAPEGVELIDGGTSGLFLLPLVERADELLVLDAVVSGAAPGTVVVLEGGQLPRLLRSRLSPHQLGLLDVLAAARLCGREPTRCTVVGVEPASVEVRWGLSEPVAAAVPDAANTAWAVLEAWRRTLSGGACVC